MIRCPPRHLLFVSSIHRRLLLSRAVVPALVLAACGGGAVEPGPVAGEPPAAGRHEGVATSIRGPHLALASGQRKYHEFGRIPAGTVALHRFRLVSAGDEDLSVSRVSSSCGCTSTILYVLDDSGEREPYRTGRPIRPGTHLELEAVLNSSSQKKEVNSNISIMTNMPSRRFGLVVRAVLVEPLTLEPQDWVSFGHLTPGTRVERELRVSSDVLPPFRLHAETDEPLEHLEVLTRPLGAGDEGRSREWRVTFVLGPDLPRGTLDHQVRLVTDVPLADPALDLEGPAGDATFETPVHVSADVERILVAEPGFLALGQVGAGKRIRKTATLRSLDAGFALSSEAPVRIVDGLRGLDYEALFTVDLRPAKERGALELVLHSAGLPEGYEGSFGARIEVELGHPEEPVLVLRFAGTCTD